MRESDEFTEGLKLVFFQMDMDFLKKVIRALKVRKVTNRKRFFVKK